MYGGMVLSFPPEGKASALVLVSLLKLVVDKRIYLLYVLNFVDCLERRGGVGWAAFSSQKNLHALLKWYVWCVCI